jgi:hypothetical protein
MLVSQFTPIPGYNRYRINKLGAVIDTEPSKYSEHILVDDVGTYYRILNPTINEEGYVSVNLKRLDRSGHDYRGIHRLLLITFVGPSPEGEECRHLNGNPSDNRLCNLKWGTHIENCKDRKDHGRDNGSRNVGITNWLAKLTEQNVREIRDLYQRGILSQGKLGKRYGVTQAVIWSIVHYKSWKHVKDNLLCNQN